MAGLPKNSMKFISNHALFGNFSFHWYPIQFLLPFISKHWLSFILFKKKLPHIVIFSRVSMFIDRCLHAINFYIQLKGQRSSYPSSSSKDIRFLYKKKKAFFFFFFAVSAITWALLSKMSKVFSTFSPCLLS
jgi:hypothetical protein